MKICIKPLVQSDRVGRLLLDELMETHKEYLPQFVRKDEVL